MSLHALANDMASKGRYGDSMLVHMSPNEVAGLHALAQSHGENLTINPETGLPEAFNLKSLLPMIIGAGLTATGVGAPMAAAMVGAGYTAATGSLQKGLIAGLGAYGGAGLGAGLSAAAGAETVATGLTPTGGVMGANPMLVQPTSIGTVPVPDITAGMGEVAAQEGAGIAGTNIPTMGRSAAELADIGTAQRVLPGDYPQGAPFAQHSALTQPIPAGNSLAAQLQQKAIDEAALQAAPTTNPEALYEPAQSAVSKDMSFMDKARQTASTYGEGLKNLSTESGRKAFMGKAGVDGAGGLLKYGLTAAAPIMQEDANPPEKPVEGNVVDYDYDPISGKYRRLRSTPASQYKNTMYAKNGGITSLLSFANGGGVDGSDPAALRASIKAGPQTQEALDAALLTYTPAQLAAAFPEYGNVADYNNAAREAYARVQQQEQAANREAVRADMAAKGEEMRIANPGGPVTTQSRPSPQMSAIPQSEIDAARAKLTPEQQQFIDWQQSQINPMTGRPVSEDFARQGVNPYLNPAQAQAQIDRAARREDLFEQAGIQPGELAPWRDPNWREKQAAAEKAEAERQQRLAAQDAKSGVTVGGGFVTGPGPSTGGGTTGSGTTGGVGSLPITNTVLPAYTGTNSPTGGISGLQVLTPQGVMGGSERGGTVSNVSQIIPAYQQYWQNAPVGSTIDFAGGKLSRISGAQAVFTAPNGSTYSMGPSSDLNIIAAQNPAIGETWRSQFGMVPQNYMQGESARAYEFLRGNEPYSVNQQIKGIARPYGEMALGLPGATFGNNAVLNQREINEAREKQKTNSNLTIPAPQYGYGVTNPGTYNMQTVYDPNTGRYMQNNMYTTPADVVANAKAAAAIDSTTGNSVDSGGVVEGADGGLMALGGMTGRFNLGGYSDGGRLLRGPGDGVSDSIPATIGNKRPARLADGEFVVPARIVSELGNGSTEAGARQLYAMMDRIQKNRRKSVGKGKVAVNSKSSKFLPA